MAKLKFPLQASAPRADQPEQNRAKLPNKLSKRLPRPLKLVTFGLPRNQYPWICAIILLACSGYLAVIHFIRFIIILADNFKGWETFYDQDFDGIHPAHAAWEFLTAVSMLFIIPSVFIDISFLPLIAVTCNVLMLGLTCLMMILKLTANFEVLRQYNKSRANVQFAFLIIWLLVDYCSCSALIVTAVLYFVYY